MLWFIYESEHFFFRLNIDKAKTRRYIVSAFCFLFLIYNFYRGTSLHVPHFFVDILWHYV